MSSNLANQFDLKDEEQAKEYLETLGVEYRFQCYKENRPDGCHRLADFFEAFRRDLEKSLKIYTMNCDDNKYGHSCFKAGNYKILGRACDKDLQASLEYHRRGCSYGFPPSCHNVGLLLSSSKLGQEPDYKQALQHFEKGCAGDDVPSCNMASACYLTGKPGIPKDMKKAFDFATKACDMGHMYACANLSIMYKRGDGVEASAELAQKYQDRAKQLQAELTTQQDQIHFGQ